ncbi:MAG: hypothetical protein HZC41_04195 [Chloroflexi bacterium]|nr:hypothetical protein [Chloroflexota bacterium]
MKRLVWAALLLSLLVTGAASAQTGCEAAFDDVNAFAAEVFEKTLPNVENGVIPWDATEWENIVRRVVGTSEFFLNNCADPDQPLAEQPEVVAQLAELSQIKPPVEAVDVGGDFGAVPLATDFEPTTEFLDLNGDGVDELLLHTQVPYFSEKTVYAIRGGLSIAFFDTEDNWQGQVIAPVSSFVTSDSLERLTYAQSENHLISAAAPEALSIFPAPEVQVLDVDGGPLTFITQHYATGTDEAKELDALTWDGRAPYVELRVAFDDWCYPGQTLDWEIRDDGSVFVPSNGNEAGSPLHCGRTNEVLFQWQDGEYAPAQ